MTPTNGRFQIHLSTCILLMFISGGLMSVFFQFSKILLTNEFPAECQGAHAAMISSFVGFSLSILIGAAYVLEKTIAAPAPIPVHVHSNSR